MGKLILNIVENGHTHYLDCDECTIVEELHNMIESFFGISAKNQLLLCSDRKLEPQSPLSAYKLPSDEHEVFLFDKSRMRSNSPNPEPEHVHVIEVPDPPIPSPSHNPHALDDASDPALRALPNYEMQFIYHFQQGEAIYGRALAKFEACESLLRKHKVQERALDIARATLDHFYNMIVQNYAEFDKCYSQQHSRHTNLIANFERDVERLRAVKIIPSLQSGGRTCLLDFVKEESLRETMEHRSNSLRQFDGKVSEFKQEFGDLKRSADHLFSDRPLFVKDLDQSIKEHQQHMNELKTIMQNLSKDVNTVRKLVNDCVASQLLPSLRPHDAVSALGPIYERHESDDLPKMHDCEAAISNLLDLSKSKKNEMNIFVHRYLQNIAHTQHTIKDVRFKFSVFQELLRRQEDLFEPLRIARGVGFSYRACLFEVVRRKESMKIYMGKAGELAEILAGERDVEIRIREAFLKTHSKYIPRDVLASMGLYDSPSPCDVNVAPFDTDLIDLDFDDIDRYAPESVLGRGVSVKRVSGSSRSSLSVSGGVEKATTVGFQDKYGCSSSQVTKGTELVGVSGTSKIEVENVKLKAELASTIASMCSMSAELDFESLDRTRLDNRLKLAAEKASEALHLKDEYQKHLQIMLKEKQAQCETYEKRIQELEKKLSDQCIAKVSDIGVSEEGSSVISGKDSVHEHDKAEERSDRMVDSSMRDLNRGEGSVCDEVEDKAQSGTSLEKELNAKARLITELENAFAERSNALGNAEAKIAQLNDEMAKLRAELEVNSKLLSESQMNGAHLEKCLHESREEAQMHLSAADRRASEYNALRSSSVKMHTLFGRLKNCVFSATVTDFSDSLQTLAESLASSSANENEDESTAEFIECLRALSDKVSFLSRQSAELLERSIKLESANESLSEELDEKKDLANTLYKKHQMEKQANKEKISIGRLELHEIAAFVLNSSGHYEAINRTCPYYYLSDESIALFADHLQIRPRYVIGQIVHIERQTAKSSETGGQDPLTLTSGSTSNPYGVPVGCEYYIVTVAILPERDVGGSASTTASSSSS